MTYQEKIRADMVQAMRDKNQAAVNTLRGLLAGFTNELVAKKKKPEDNLTDDEAIAVILRAIKQRKDSIEQFKKGGRDDLVATETAELVVLEKYRPQFMPVEEIAVIARKKKEEMGITDKAKMGQLVGTLMKELKGKADGADVKTAVESLFG